MTTFRFKADLVIAATSAEDLLSKIAAHLGDTARHLGNGHPVADVCKHFSIEKTDAEPAELDDHILAEHGPAELELDPESPAGKARAAQIEREKSEREARKASLANVGKSDAEIMAEVKAKEEAADPGHPSYKPTA